MRAGLVVEDVAEARAWLGEALQEAFPGIEVTTATTVKEALEHLERARFDVALVDFGLPDGLGIEVVIRVNRDHPDTVCVVVTIHADDESLFTALKAGAQGYLMKDQGKAQIAERLRRIAQGEPPLSPSIARRLLNHFRQSDDPAPYGLTHREREILAIIAKGISVPALAKMIGISPNTAAGHVKAIYRKLNVSSRAEATLAAARMGLIKS